MRDFLLEIGSEEIPASFQRPAAEALRRELQAWFKESRIQFGPSRVFYGMRRLAVRFQGVAESQEAKTVEIQGPPRKAAFDATGKPTKTALGFVRTHGRELSDLVIRQTPKGEYLFITKTLAPQPTTELLAQALPEIISRLPFPKNMRWGAEGFRFARPIRWLVALLGSEPITFRLEDVTSGCMTWGHRLSEPDRATLNSPADYESVLEQMNVIVDPLERRTRVQTAIEQLLAGTGQLIAD
ncbi:MAG: glycine--tRNA ligase subunit beta, partial [candidate division WOR-3 bacterium]